MNKFMHKNMKEENTSYRPEQMFIKELLEEIPYFSTKYAVKTEFKVDLKDHSGNRTCAVLDIALFSLIPEFDNIGIRVMGEIHEKQKKKIYDEDQKCYLIQKGWRVVDVFKWKHPHFWKPKKHDREFLKSELMKIILG